MNEMVGTSGIETGDQQRVSLGNVICPKCRGAEENVYPLRTERVEHDNEHQDVDLLLHFTCAVAGHHWARVFIVHDQVVMEGTLMYPDLTDEEWDATWEGL